MSDIKTVDDSIQEITPQDSILIKKKADVAGMRAALLSCADDPQSTISALQRITVLRVYHQVARIIKYLEQMDKIEEKLYQSIDCTLDKLDPENPTAWMVLLNIQERLQKNLIESHKLLQPYLNVQEFNLDSMMPVSTTSISASIIPRESRDRLRISAQQVLDALSEVEDND